MGFGVGRPWKGRNPCWVPPSSLTADPCPDLSPHSFLRLVLRIPPRLQTQPFVWTALLQSYPLHIHPAGAKFILI